MQDFSSLTASLRRSLSPYLVLGGLLATVPLAALAQTGGVGIGTTAPDVSAALDIVSSTKGALLPRVADATALATPATGLLVFQTNAPAGFYYNAGTPAAPNWQRLSTAAATTASNGLTKTGNDVALGGTLTQATTIAQAGFNLNLAGTGNVGIGTGTSPAAKLTVQPATEAEVGLRVTNGVADGTAISGNIVLQTLVGGNSGFSFLGFNGANNNGEVRYGTSKNRWRLGVDQRGTADGFFLETYDGTTSVNVLRATTAGNVGIGTATPGQPLEVVGNATQGIGLRSGATWDHLYMYHDGLTAVVRAGGADTGLALQVGNGSSGTYGGQPYTEAMRLLASGNVGIGTATPGQRLEVAGTIKVTGTVGTDGVIFPDGTKQTTAATGGGAGDNLGNHTATQALNLQANALTGTGASIAGVGVGITAQGGLNLGQNSVGNGVFLGYQAGINNQPNTGTNPQQGTLNQFVGYQAGPNNTTGRQNVFAGFQSGFSNTSGSTNTFTGLQSGNANTTGDNNTFTGGQSGNANTVGSNNVFTGVQSGLNNFFGNSNAFYGTLSGQYNATGNRNTALGTSSGPASGSTNLSNTTAIGADAVVTQSNSVVLGNNANVGIGTSAPATKLDVNGNLRLAVRSYTTLVPVNATLQLTAADVAFSIYRTSPGNYLAGIILPDATAGQVLGQQFTVLNTATESTLTVRGTNTDNAADVVLAAAGTAGIHGVMYVWGGSAWVRVQ